MFDEIVFRVPETGPSPPTEDISSITIAPLPEACPMTGSVPVAMATVEP